MTSLINPYQHSGILTINLGALAANYKKLAAIAAPAKCAALVKANAYGIGIEQAVPTLLKTGCRTFFVAVLSEALRVRHMTSDAIIYVLNGLLPNTASIYADYNLRPVLGSKEEILEWQSFCIQSGFTGASALHVDTGMNRLGLRPEQALELHKNSAFIGINFQLLMSHFISSEEKLNNLNNKQINDIINVKNQVKIDNVSISNSSGFFLPQMPFMNLVRAGYALYGGNPTPNLPNPMQNVVTLEAPIIMVRDVPANETVGYNAQWTAKTPRRIAVISAGYADGLSRQLTATDTKSGGYVWINHQLCPFAGRVSMDLITIDVSDVPQVEVERGTLVQLLGNKISIDDMAIWANTNGYEILTNLGQRYERKYIGDASKY
jgi:alanine racemase